MLRSLSLFVGLAILWLLLSGYFDEPLLLVGDENMGSK